MSPKVRQTSEIRNQGIICREHGSSEVRLPVRIVFRAAYVRACGQKTWRHGQGRRLYSVQHCVVRS